MTDMDRAEKLYYEGRKAVTPTFTVELAALLRKHEIDHIMCVPDWILAEYLDDHLEQMGTFLNRLELDRHLSRPR